MRGVLLVVLVLAASAGPTMACAPKVFTLYFNAADATLRDSQEQEWTALVAVSRRDDLARLDLTGSADRSLGEAAWRELARARLDAILKRLSDAGAPGRKLQGRVRGDEASLAATLTDPVLSNSVEAVPVFVGPDGALVDGCGRVIEGGAQ